MAQPLVVDIRQNSLDDGPGIRSVVFFKGCRLRCPWCQNPEALSPAPQLQIEQERCLGCGACARACPSGAAARADRSGCRACGACAAVCPAGARRLVGRAYTLPELAERLSRDAPFFRRSGGGVTFSGGEPALFPEYTGALAGLLRQRGIAVLLETAGHFDWPAFERVLLPGLSQVYFDLKLADPERHRRVIGVDNARILDNLRRLVKSGVALLPRLALVPGQTDDVDNLRALARLVRESGLGELAVLPYNPLWVAKRRALGLEAPDAPADWMPAERVEACREIARAEGLAVR